MASGLGIHLEHPHLPTLEYLLRGGGCGALGFYGFPIVKIVVADRDCILEIPKIRRCAPDAFIIARAYEPWLVNDPWGVNPIEFFEKFAIQLKSIPGAWESIDALEGRNEANIYPGIDTGSVDTYKAIAGWEWVYAERVISEGKRPVVLNLSTGWPANDEQANALIVKDGAILGSHYYHNPRHPNPDDREALIRLSNRNGSSPILLTEFGYEPRLYESDSREYKRSWKAHWSPASYAQWAIGHDISFQQTLGSRYWGLCWFTFGSSDWGHTSSGQEGIDSLYELGFQSMPKLRPWKADPPVEPPVPTPPTELRYFKPSEFKRYDELDKTLLSFLDEVRHRAGILFYITSDKRTPEENKAVGGHPQSLHLWGQAVDFVVRPWSSQAIDKVLSAYYNTKEDGGWGSFELGIGGCKRPPHFHLGRYSRPLQHRLFIE